MNYLKKVFKIKNLKKIKKINLQKSKSIEFRRQIPIVQALS